METKEWQERLERTFQQDGLVGGHLVPVLRAERKCGNFVESTFHGHLVLADCFQAFFVDTLQLAESKFRASPLFSTLRWYAYLLLVELSNFRTIRAAEILFRHGRGGQGYGLLRDLKDRAILLGAVGNSFTTLSETTGLDGNANVSDEFSARTARVKTRRKRVEEAIRAKMIGPQSGLSQETIKQVQKWDEMFHLEVHGARVTSVFEDQDWMTKGGLLPILPTPNLDTLAMYMNRFSEVCWMVLRTFPILQLKPEDFGSDWAEKWRILDESFLHMVQGLGKLGKQIASAIIELVSIKFAFGPGSTYPPEEAGV